MGRVHRKRDYASYPYLACDALHLKVQSASSAANPNLKRTATTPITEPSRRNLASYHVNHHFNPRYILATLQYLLTFLSGVPP